MKKVLLVLAILLAAGLAYWNWPGPAPELPVVAEVQSVDMEATEPILLRLNGFYPIALTSFPLTESNEIATFLTYLSEGRRTRQSSTNDQPSISPYIRVNIHKVDGEKETVYIYHQKGKTYLEVPYQGVYKLKRPLDAWLTEEANRGLLEFERNITELTPSAED